MPRHVLRKSPIVLPNPNLVLTQGYANSLRVLRARPGNFAGPLKGTALDKMPVAPTAQQQLEAQDAPTRAADITRNLFTSRQQEQLWQGTLGDIVEGARNEANLRQQLFTAVKSASLPPLVGKTLLRRSVQWWHKRLTQH